MINSVTNENKVSKGRHNFYYNFRNNKNKTICIFFRNETSTALILNTMDTWMKIKQSLKCKECINQNFASDPSWHHTTQFSSYVYCWEKWRSSRISKRNESYTTGNGKVHVTFDILYTDHYLYILYVYWRCCSENNKFDLISIDP